MERFLPFPLGRILTLFDWWFSLLVHRNVRCKGLSCGSDSRIHRSNRGKHLARLRNLADSCEVAPSPGCGFGSSKVRLNGLVEFAAWGSVAKYRLDAGLGATDRGVSCIDRLAIANATNRTAPHPCAIHTDPGERHTKGSPRSKLDTSDEVS